MTDMWMPGAEQRPQPGGVTMNTSLPSRVTWHITWDALTNGQQPSFDGVAGYLERMGYCPTLMWDPWTGRVVQFYPADQGGRALVNWNQDGQYNIQIETFFSPGAVRDGVTYQTVADTPCVGLDEILAWTDSLGIPRVWPMGAPQWTGNSRDPGIWNSEAGHYGHCNVPDNTHTDPGPMPDLNRGIGAAAAGPITPIQEDTLSQAEVDQLYSAFMTRSTQLEDSLTKVINDAAAKTPVQVWSYTNPNIPGGDAFQHLRDIPANVLNQSFKLADGTVTNLAGILTAIHAQPVAAAGPGADAQTVANAVVSTLSKQLGK